MKSHSLANSHSVKNLPAATGQVSARPLSAAKQESPSRSPKENTGREPRVLFQKAFKSPSQKQYSALLKELESGNHLLTLSEARRDAATGQMHKTRISIFGEDLTAFFRLLHETATFIRSSPLPEEVRRRREKFWARKARQNGAGA
jgi:ERCC4-type nuclease